MRIKSKDLSDLVKLIKVLEQLGIEEAYPSLKDEPVTPKECLQQSKVCLDLLAYHGNKWCNELWLPIQLERLRLKEGKVRFLLSDSITEANKIKLLDITNKFPNVFSVRLFSQKALFRCVFIDSVKMLLTHYGHEVISNDGINERGWESPQLIVNMTTDWSIGVPFRQYFNEMWDKAHPLSPALLDTRNDNVVKRKFQ